jgi:hypothetical protein
VDSFGSLRRLGAGLSPNKAQTARLFGPAIEEFERPKAIRNKITERTHFRAST